MTFAQRIGRTPRVWSRNNPEDTVLARPHFQTFYPQGHCSMSEISGNQTVQYLANTADELGAPNQTWLFIALTIFATCVLTLSC